MKNRPTISDVARRAGVAVGTASQALNNKTGVSYETIKKVIRAANELKYIPSRAARELKGKKSNLISLHLIVPQNNKIHPSTWGFYFPVIQGFINELNIHRYKIHLELNNIQDLLDHSFLSNYIGAYNIQGAGFIITSNGDYRGLLTAVDEYSIPIVTIYTKLYDSISSVYIDNLSASYNVTSWLKQLGHKKIAFISGPGNDFAANERKNGYLKNMQENNDDVFIFEGNWDVESGEQQLKNMIYQGIFPTAVFCANDHMAMGVLKACRHLQIKIPDRISLVGFDDTMMSKVSDPPITSVRMPLIEMGQESAKLLCNSIQANKKTNPEHRLLQTKLIIRNSVISLK